MPTAVLLRLKCSRKFFNRSPTALLIVIIRHEGASHDPVRVVLIPVFDLNYRGDFKGMVRSHYAVPYAEAPNPGLKGLYLHIPFCDTICNFCPFNKSVGSPDRQARYVEAIRAELRQLAQTPRISAWQLDSVYMGGGTPSVLTAQHLTALLCDVKALFTLGPDAEISVEVEPEECVRGEAFGAAASWCDSRQLRCADIRSEDPSVRQPHGDPRSGLRDDHALQQVLRRHESRSDGRPSGSHPGRGRAGDGGSHPLRHRQRERVSRRLRNDDARLAGADPNRFSSPAGLFE